MDTRTALLDAAEQVGRARGFDGFSYADLAKAVGIRKASIHHHFPTKGDLALALVQRYRSDFFERLAHIETRYDRAGDRLRAYVQLYRDALSQGEKTCLCVAFGVAPDSIPAPVGLEIRQFHSESLEWLEALFALGRDDLSIESIGDPVREAAACLAQMEGGQLVARSAKDVTLFDDALSLLLARIR